MYEEFSTDYDRFVDWPARLAVEMPFIERQLERAGARRVLDTACGTGMHSLALASSGYQTVGTDISSGMIEVARRNASRAGSSASFDVAGFGRLADRVGGGFDAVLCLGNSLPHILSTELLDDALEDFRACLRPAGVILIQNRNFDAVLARGDRWMDPQAYTEEGREWLFVRFYDSTERTPFCQAVKKSRATLERPSRMPQGPSGQRKAETCHLKTYIFPNPIARQRFSKIDLLSGDSSMTSWTMVACGSM